MAGCRHQIYTEINSRSHAVNESHFGVGEVATQGLQDFSKRHVVDVDITEKNEPARLFRCIQQGARNVLELPMHVSQKPEAS